MRKIDVEKEPEAPQPEELDKSEELVLPDPLLERERQEVIEDVEPANKLPE